jgi:hypothetical protein
MPNANSIISSWLQGIDAAGGMTNPAGSLYTNDQVAMQSAGDNSGYGVLNTGPIRCDSVSAPWCFG